MEAKLTTEKADYISQRLSGLGATHVHVDIQRKDNGPWKMNIHLEVDETRAVYASVVGETMTIECDGDRNEEMDEVQQGLEDNAATTKLCFADLVNKLSQHNQ